MKNIGIGLLALVVIGIFMVIVQIALAINWADVIAVIGFMWLLGWWVRTRFIDEPGGYVEKKGKQ